MKNILPLKISVSGVRGVVGDSLTPQLAARFAAAFGTYVGGGRVAVGRDARASGEMLTNAVVSGLLATGCQPVAIGIAPIPSALVFTKESRAAGGIIVTASHNPGEWNGLKLISGRGLYLTAAEVEELLDIYHQGDFVFAAAERHRPVVVEDDPCRFHIEKLLDRLDFRAIRKRRFRVAADCAGGAGSTLLPVFLDALGCTAFLRNAVPDGGLSHSSEPVAESLAGLCRLVREKKADVGFAQDADADRLAVVDERGRALGEEMTLALAARHVLSREPGPVVVNLSTTKAIDDIAARAGAPVFRTKIGEINVVEGVLDRKAAIGGEGNGGVIWPRVHACRDSFAGIGLVLESLALSGKSVSAARGEIPNYVMIKDRIDGTPEEAQALLRKIGKAHSREILSALDGLKFGFGDSWVHIRPSNTEPIIRILAEAPTAARARRLVETFKRELGAAGRNSGRLRKV